MSNFSNFQSQGIVYVFRKNYNYLLNVRELSTFPDFVKMLPKVEIVKRIFPLNPQLMAQKRD